MLSNISIIIVILLFGIRVIRLIIKKVKKKNELAIKAEDKIREDTLDEYILNPNVPIDSKRIQGAKPIEVSYSANKTAPKASNLMQNNKSARGSARIMVQLVENSELSVRKYVLDPHDGIYIGTGVGVNNVTIPDPEIDVRQCRIIEHQGRVFVQNIGSKGKVTLIRGKNRAFIEQKASELHNKDALIIGKILFKIELIHMQA